jgi:hypothetical protein
VLRILDKEYAKSSVSFVVLFHVQRRRFSMLNWVKPPWSTWPETPIIFRSTASILSYHQASTIFRKEFNNAWCNKLMERSANVTRELAHSAKLPTELRFVCLTRSVQNRQQLTMIPCFACGCWACSWRQCRWINYCQLMLSNRGQEHLVLLWADA